MVSKLPDHYYKRYDGRLIVNLLMLYVCVRKEGCFKGFNASGVWFGRRQTIN